MLVILGLGFALGLRHAMEADHLAAVATIASNHARPADIVKHGLTWGLGHALTLFAVAGAALLLGNAIPDRLSSALELAVGVMLSFLGGQLLWQLWRRRVHLHAHEHEGERHLHFHSHARPERAVVIQVDPHRHPHGFRWRTLMVGLMHGMAGSAALLLLVMTQVHDPWRGLAYVLVFGVGSMVGMGVLSMIIAVPLSLSARFLTLANNGLQLGIGVGTVCLGVFTLWRHLP